MQHAHTAVRRTENHLAHCGAPIHPDYRDFQVSKGDMPEIHNRREGDMDPDEVKQVFP